MTTYPLVSSSSLPQNKIHENQPPHPSPKRKLDLLGALFHWLLRLFFLTVFILIVYTYNWLHEIWYLLFTCVLLILLIRCEVHSKVQIYFGNDSPWLALHTEKNSKALNTPQNRSLHSQNRIMEVLPSLQEFNFGQNLRDNLGWYWKLLGEHMKNSWEFDKNTCGKKFQLRAVSPCNKEKERKKMKIIMSSSLASFKKRITTLL